MKKKFKLRYRIIILTVIFFGALYYFSKNYLVVRNFDLSADTTVMAEATLPNISLVVGDDEINRLYGYSANLDWTLNRETITPIGKDKSFVVRVEENEMTVRRLKYELFDVASGVLLDSGTISALTSERTGNDAENGKTVKAAKIKLNAELNEGTEYSVKITLVTSTSKRVYYYTRVKLYNNGHLAEKLDYVRWFRDSALNKINRESVEKNLETKSNSDTSSFAHTDIHSSWEMVSWGELQPQIVTELPPTVTDFYEGTASVVLSYVVQMDAGSGQEQFLVREIFRFLYTDIRTYLYNYEREVETIYDVNHTSLSKDDLKLGITSDTGMEILSTDNTGYVAFVRNRELWCYDREENAMNRVFSFRGEETDLMELYDAHDIKLLSLRKNGDMDFLVYGYMNRGEYEGRVGIILYRYYQEEARVEELMYIPVNTTYQLLKGEVNEFAYMSSYDVFYFTIYNAIYSYNLTTKSLQQLADGVPPEHIVFLKEMKQVVWQEAEDAVSDRLTVMNLESGTTSVIGTGAGEVICLLGKIDNNLVYGYARTADIAQNYDGTQIVPLYRIVIADLDGTVFKEYSQPGYYVTQALFEENVIHLTRVKKDERLAEGYVAAAADAIQNRVEPVTPSVYVTGRVTELAKTEYYVTFPGDVKIDEIPELKTVSFTVLSSDPTVRITASSELPERYLTYSFGRVVISSPNVVDAIRRADEDESVGAVINGNGKVIWERGVKANRTTISKVTPAVVVPGLSNLQNALKMVFSHEGFDVDVSGISFGDRSVTEWLEYYMKVTALDLKGASLDEVLYYVYKKYPVIAVLGDNKVYVITGYDQTTVEVVDPVFRATKKIEKEQAAELFEESGNVFFTYID